MAQKLDAFVVGVGMKYYETNDNYLTVGDFISINPNHTITKDGKQIGSVAKNDKYYDEAFNLLDTFIFDNVYQLQGDDYIILESEDIEPMFGDEDGRSIGKVIYATEDISLIYLGTADEDFFFPEEDFDDDVCFTLTEKGEDYLSRLCDMCEENTERKEEKNMDNMFGKLGFGKCHDSRFALSINGIAVRQNSGKYVVYNKDTNEFVDTTDMLINIKDALFTLPATEIAVGDTVIHENKIYYITSTSNGIKAVSYDECVEATLIPKTTMFGLKYFTKVFSIFGDNFAATGELFSNPMVLMSLISGEGNTDISKLMLMSSLSKGDIGNNPLLFALLNKDGNNSLSDIAMMTMFANGNNPFAPKAPKKSANKE